MKSENQEMNEAEETVMLEKFEESQRNTHAQGGTEGNDSDEEEGHGHGHGQRVQCQQQ